VDGRDDQARPRPVATAEEALALAGVENVSRETLDRLTAFVALVEKWQGATNLIAPGTLPDIWRRHIADSAQLVALFSDAQVWLDLGSGAGFPGLVVAIIRAERGGQVHLVESDTRKAAFLREAIRATAARATVHQGRIEDVLAEWRIDIDLVTARALAPLARLFDLVAPLIPLGVRGAFQKGREYRREIAEASKSWEFDLVKHKSRIEDDAVILDITHLRPKQPTRPA
jgi:16S rRNA (guanine527-N7)-methyltransferase